MVTFGAQSSLLLFLHVKPLWQGCWINLLIAAVQCSVQDTTSNPTLWLWLNQYCVRVGDVALLSGCWKEKGLMSDLTPYNLYLFGHFCHSFPFFPIPHVICFYFLYFGMWCKMVHRPIDVSLRRIINSFGWKIVPFFYLT